MSQTIVKLRYMANQIARNFEAQGEQQAVAATADHIATFWDPSMKAAILADNATGLSAIAKAAIAHLASAGAPPPQTRATKFNAVDEAGRSDAG